MTTPGNTRDNVANRHYALVARVDSISTLMMLVRNSVNSRAMLAGVVADITQVQALGICIAPNMGRKA